MAQEKEATNSQAQGPKKQALVSDIMVKNVMSVRVNDPFSKVEEIFRLYPIRHIPVLDEKEALCGMITQRDFLRVAKPRKTDKGDIYLKEDLDEIVLKYVMTPNPIALTPDNTVANAVELMAERKFGAIPIVGDHKQLVGIISQIDVLKFLHNMLVSETEKSYIDTMYVRLREIDSIYRVALFNLENNTQKIFPVMFLSRAHAEYLHAIRLAMTAIMSESYKVLVRCMENSIYGYYLHLNPKSSFTWLEKYVGRNDEEIRATDEFKIPTLLEVMHSQEAQLGRSSRELYTRLNDYILNPPELGGAFSDLTKKQESGSFEFNVDYLLGDTPALRSCLKTSAEVGLCSLLIFRSIFGDTFEQMGLTRKVSYILHRLYAE